MKCGIVGLPNVGKSTLFNCLSNAKAIAANYPFATIEPNIGVVPVPDERLQILSAIESMSFDLESKPKVIIAHTTKGKGVSFIEGHGPWHHRTPNEEEMADIKRELSQDE